MTLCDCGARADSVQRRDCRCRTDGGVRSKEHANGLCGGRFCCAGAQVDKKNVFRFPMKQVAGMLLGPAGTLVSLTFQRRPAAGQPFERVHTVLRRVDVRALRASHEQHVAPFFFLCALSCSRSRSRARARSLYVALSTSRFLSHALYVTVSADVDERGRFCASASDLRARQR